MTYIRFIGAAVILGALVMLANNGVVLWHGAHNLNSEFPELAAWSAMGMLAVEALGLMVAPILWRDRAWGMSILTVVFTLCCAAYLLRLDIAVNVTGQADKIAERNFSSAQRSSQWTELQDQILLRDKLQAKKTLTQDEGLTLESVRIRIKEIEDGWKGAIVKVGEATPDAGLMSRWLGVDIQTAEDAFQILPVLVGVLMRLLALPIGLRLLTVRAEPNEQAQKEKERSALPEKSEPAPAPAPEVIKQAAKVKPKGRDNIVLHEDGGIPKSSVIYDDGLGRGSVASFIRECLEPAPGKSLKSSITYEFYVQWCDDKGISALSHARFGEGFAQATGRSARVKRDGAHYQGWRTKKRENGKGAGQSTRGKDVALAAVH